MEPIKLHSDSQYKKWLSDLKERVRNAQIKAALSVNKELLMFYWELGADIMQMQTDYKWGDGLFLQLSQDLAKEFPGIKGFSVTNLRYIRQWYLFYHQELTIHQQAVGEFEQQANTHNKEEFGQRVVSQITKQPISQSKSSNNKLDKEQNTFLKLQTFSGNDFF